MNKEIKVDTSLYETLDDISKIVHIDDIKKNADGTVVKTPPMCSNDNTNWYYLVINNVVKTDQGFCSYCHNIRRSLYPDQIYVLMNRKPKSQCTRICSLVKNPAHAGTNTVYAEDSIEYGSVALVTNPNIMTKIDNNNYVIMCGMSTESTFVRIDTRRAYTYKIGFNMYITYANHIYTYFNDDKLENPITSTPVSISDEAALSSCTITIDRSMRECQDLKYSKRKHTVAIKRTGDFEPIVSVIHITVIVYNTQYTEPLLADPPEGSDWAPYVHCKLLKRDITDLDKYLANNGVDPTKMERSPDAEKLIEEMLEKIK